MPRLASIVVVLGGCGRLGFDASPATDAVQAEGVIAMPGCRADELAGPFTADFATGQPAWSSVFDVAPSSVAFGGGVMTVVPGATPAYSGINGPAADVRERRFALEVIEMVDPAASAQAVFQLADAATPDAYLQLDQTQGLLNAVAFTASGSTPIANRPWDPSADRWWQLREHAGAVAFETSPDGIAWDPFATTPSPSYLDAATLGIAAGAYNADARPLGRAVFDNLFDCR